MRAKRILFDHVRVELVAPLDFIVEADDPRCSVEGRCYVDLALVPAVLLKEQQRLERLRHILAGYYFDARPRAPGAGFFSGRT